MDAQSKCKKNISTFKIKIENLNRSLLISSQTINILFVKDKNINANYINLSNYISIHQIKLFTLERIFVL